MLDNKGSVADLMLVVFVCFIVAISGVIGLYVMGQFNQTLANTTSGTIVTSYALNATAKVVSAYGVFDTSFPLMFIGMNLAIMFLSYLVRTHPIFLIFAVLLLAVVILTGATMANAYQTFAESPQLSSTASQFPLTAFIMTNLVMLQIIFGFIDIIILYSSIGGEQQ
jgi:hypothetical protein